METKEFNYLPTNPNGLQQEAYMKTISLANNNEGKQITNTERERMYLGNVIFLINEEYFKQTGFKQRGMGYAIRYNHFERSLYTEFINGYSDLCFENERDANICIEAYGDTIIDYLKRY